MADSDLVHNERVKAFSAALHSLGVFTIGAGAFAPIFAANLGNDPELRYLFLSPVAIIAGICLIALGQLFLKCLRG